MDLSWKKVTRTADEWLEYYMSHKESWDRYSEMILLPLDWEV